ncbi:MAG: GNAT family N-acetyltransferase [Phycisphaerales bacterium]
MISLSRLAELEEHRCALGTSEVAGESLHIAGGIASRGAPRTWVNTAVGLGMGVQVSRDDVARLVSWYAEAGQEPQVEVTPYSHPTLIEALNAAGFRTKRFEQVMFRELRDETIVTAPLPPAGVSIERVDPADERRVREAATVIAGAFAPDGSGPSEEDIALFERCARHARSALFAAYAGHVCAGAGFLETLGEVAALYGLGVAAEHRRRGIQQALIAARVDLARRQGACVVTISGPPGMGTERNVRRAGFQVGYTRIIMRAPLADAQADPDPA